MSNHLSRESSPYLLQHADNPVDWFPWGSEAFEKAKQEDKPVFLSVGYSTCHWCHVMAHESFENKKIAEILNQYFISVKVDREERPDVDSVYMSVCQALTGSGGWPMSIFMTPEQKPFYAGTYFPPEPRYGMASFRDLLLRIAELWRTDREGLRERAEDILAQLGAGGPQGSSADRMQGGEAEINVRLPELAAEQFRQSFDCTYGGFGSAPKFPVPHNLLFLILYAKLTEPAEPSASGSAEGSAGLSMLGTAEKPAEPSSRGALAMAEKTLLQMRRGGLFDQIGYGFSRYSTDRFYLAPHFEKMLYDNALLILAYASAYKAAGNAVFLDTAEKAAAYALREMRNPEGAFYAAQDADSEGREGRYYLFSYGEVLQVLGPERGPAFCAHYGITETGNFEGCNIPNLLQGNEISDAFDGERQKLYDYRKKRMRLHLDDKILTSWNALMIAALSVLYRVSGKPVYLEAAEAACRFIDGRLAEGTVLFVSCRGKRRSVRGFLDDYAYYCAALLTLYEATGKDSYLARAEAVCGEAGRQFTDPGGGYFLCGTDNDRLVTSPKETYDGALPSGNAVMAYCLVRLSQLTDRENYGALAKRQLAYLSKEAGEYPMGHSMFLLALLYYLYPPMRITVVGQAGRTAPEQEESSASMLAGLPLYAQIRILGSEEEGCRRLDGKTTYYVCKGHTCLPPTDEVSDFYHKPDEKHLH